MVSFQRVEQVPEVINLEKRVLFSVVLEVSVLDQGGIIAFEPIVRQSIILNTCDRGRLFISLKSEKGRYPGLIISLKSMLLMT